MDHIQEQFVQQLRNYNVALSELQLAQFETYFQELVQWNEKMNLTGITEREQVYVKHFYDSLSISFFIAMHNIDTMADIGSGAGFPSIPLKIAFPHLRVTIVDSLNKRIQFLKHVVSEVGLEGVNCVHGRAEDVARLSEHRDHYDLVTARAVARLAVLGEFCLPFTQAGGRFVAMKGNEIEEELREAAHSLKELKGKYETTYRFQLPDVEQSTRHLVVISKQGRTPSKYPRKAGTPVKSPLV
ncbi:16S rRNA (guanine(527)-N(7))-methyltransferase RsmG [Paenibacillus xerothermodurans]|uniref:Ribosomal RNA small subunit methyltransferase G n=1 Tax=Paenibacillus xerothermodurans TaxID=1977292 RepID=A0A2W1N5H1_PAEXE|nr:16S rRNA (guanine(527)-N(7))-methyltransferase RsmG [Paenibacillus xerothermodurans]PZE19084.1 16S rRNA (guanine(527)-N(7))-methyltransferase RsmG [Paenibacillus xerothermodurans]